MEKPHIHSISEITLKIQNIIESNFKNIWIEGEISNLRIPKSGHCYFTLKDSLSQISCVIFKRSLDKNNVKISDGLKIQALGDASVYEIRGQYQIIIKKIITKGDGTLQIQFEALKNKLKAEGLFDTSKKKPIPIFPKKIGIVTSPTGAAIQDMINILNRRAPWINIYIYPAKVQGKGSAKEISEGINFFDNEDEYYKCDIIIIARGGGSIEDIWEFNDESLAREISKCSIPIISGVGHEIDFTITDFVADRREPTPSSAAEFASPDKESLLKNIESLKLSIMSNLNSRINYVNVSLENISQRLYHNSPRKKIDSYQQFLDYIDEKIQNVITIIYNDNRSLFQNTKRGLNSFKILPILEKKRSEINISLEKLNKIIQTSINNKKQYINYLKTLINSLSHKETIKRGFSITYSKDKEALTSTNQVKKGDIVETVLSNGKFISEVK